mmetsp:Transcript_105103/g.250198  ORF Transcript_105103/g.250198 Transcript_105103/m.250198 type:complete len:373 (+) Transcript_105103:44-1162(+)
MEGWLEKRGAAAEYTWQRRWCVLDPSGFHYYADSEKQQLKGQLPLGPGAKAIRFANLRAPGESIKHRKEKPHGFALDLNPAAGKQRQICYFDAESAETLTEWLSAIEGWVQTAMWKPGDLVQVREAFDSDSEDRAHLELGTYGIVVEVDAQGDTFVDFCSHNARQWVFKKNQHKIQAVPDGLKDVYLEIVPQNDLINHWALQIGDDRIFRCYEFEADGICMGRTTALDKGYPITKQLLQGRTSQSHGAIAAWSRGFGEANSYDAAGNGLFGGKNCQDFVVELCGFLEIDVEQLPFRQAEKVKTMLGAGALVAADAALGTGLLAGAMDVGAAGFAAAAGAAMSPAVMATAAVVTVVAGTGMLVTESARGQTWM